MIYQAVILYHASLIDDYRVLTYDDFDTKEKAEKFIEDFYKNHVYNVECDPDNPIGDLYDSFIQEI